MISVFGHWSSRRSVVLFFAELAALVTGLSAACAATAASSGGAGILRRAVAAALLVQLALYLCDLYDARIAWIDSRRGDRTLAALGLSMLALAALAVVAPGWSLPSGSLALGAAAVAAAITGLRAVHGYEGPRRVVILGSGARARWVRAALVRELAGDYTLAGVLDDRCPHNGPMLAPVAVEGASRALVACRRWHASILVVACDDRRGVLPVDALLEARAAGIEVMEASVFLERTLRRVPVERVGGGELALAPEWKAVRQSGAQRALDLVVASVLIVLSAPLLLVAMAAVRLSSPGPVFYRQERVGRGGRVFRVTKLRTMRADAEAASGPTWAGASDPRVTPVGRLLRKTRLDELPQLWSVLAGDMSMVGPRPERPFFVEQLERAIPFYALRHAARPGITGWAQIRYPYGASVEDAKAKLEHDLYYLKHRSLWLDLLILFHTVKTVLLGRGAR